MNGRRVFGKRIQTGYYDDEFISKFMSTKECADAALNSIFKRFGLVFEIVIIIAKVTTLIAVPIMLVAYYNVNLVWLSIVPMFISPFVPWGIRAASLYLLGVITASHLVFVGSVYIWYCSFEVA